MSSLGESPREIQLVKMLGKIGIRNVGYVMEIQIPRTCFSRPNAELGDLKGLYPPRGSKARSSMQILSSGGQEATEERDTR